MIFLISPFAVIGFWTYFILYLISRIFRKANSYSTQIGDGYLDSACLGLVQSLAALCCLTSDNNLGWWILFAPSLVVTIGIGLFIFAGVIFSTKIQ